MNGKVIAALVVVGLVVTCFIGSLMAAGLYVFTKGVEANRAADTTDPVASRKGSSRVTPPTDPLEDSQPGTTPGDTGFTAPDFAVAELAVFHLPTPKGSVKRALTAALKGTHYTLSATDEVEDGAERSVALQERTTADYEVLQGSLFDTARGLSDADKRHLTESKAVSVLRFRAPAGTIAAREFASITAGFAKATGGVIWDEEVREYLSLAELKTRRIDKWEGDVPHAGMNITVLMADEEDGLTRLTTTGLRHFGLPELQLDSIPHSSVNGAGNLMNALSQRLVEAPTLARPGAGRLELGSLKHEGHRSFLESGCLEGAERATDYELADAALEEGPITLRVDFPGDGAPSERVDAAVQGLFGSHDEVSQVEHDDELKALSAKQMAVFDKVWVKRFKKGLKPNEVLLVKAPFTTTAGGNEWMWVEVSRMKANGTIDGMLSNDPADVPELHSGSPVTVKRADLFDWSFLGAAGEREGNETGKVMMRRQGKEPDW